MVSLLFIRWKCRSSLCGLLLDTVRRWWDHRRCCCWLSHRHYWQKCHHVCHHACRSHPNGKGKCFRTINLICHFILYFQLFGYHTYMDTCPLDDSEQNSCYYGHLGILLTTGLLVNGPYALITTAVSAELGTHESLKVTWPDFFAKMIISSFHSYWLGIWKSPCNSDLGDRRHRIYWSSNWTLSGWSHWYRSDFLHVDSCRRTCSFGTFIQLYLFL